MSATAVAKSSLPFYPAYTFSASSTWFAWVKLTCDSIHHDLRTRSDFPSNLIDAPSTNGRVKPLLLFYLNHPIQFVQVVGVVVAIEDFYEHFFLLTIDDSSGSTIDVIFWKPRPRRPAGESQESAEDAACADQKSGGGQIDEANILVLLPTLKIGHCVQAKGTISEFRGTRQLVLLRLARVRTTAAELKLVDARTAFYTTVLSQPWLLSSSKLKRLREKAEGSSAQDDERLKRARKRAQAKSDREVRHEKEILRQWEEEEQERGKAAQRAKRAGDEAMALIGEKRRKLAIIEDDDAD